ncbi:MAG: alpha/beta fold hydrolase [Hyphomicrobiaceae bacterium]|nr:alpha/beta fold hydrolase [Hyphomicrobiaceae bacterium]
MLSRPSPTHDRPTATLDPPARDRAGGWLQWPLARREAAVRLFCFHPAGVGASVYRQWAAALPADIELAAVQLPGRANRLAEPPLASIPALVDALATSLAPHFDRPFAFFGHSMGAVLAHELTHALRDRGLPGPRHLIVSGRRAPTVPDPFPPVRHLPDDAFVAEINRRYNAIPAEILAHRDVLELLLPCLRADIAALEEFVAPARPPLDAPIAVFGGDSDRQTPVAHLEPWRQETAAGSCVRVFPGGHFYLDPLRDQVVAEVAALLRSDTSLAGGSPPP